MGSTYALGLAEAVQEGAANLDQALGIHFAANHYPPLPASLIPVAKRAIAKAKRGEWDTRVRLPATLRHQRYGRLVPVRILVEDLHLDAFLDLEDDK